MAPNENLFLLEEAGLASLGDACESSCMVRTAVIFYGGMTALAIVWAWLGGMGHPLWHHNPPDLHGILQWAAVGGLFGLGIAILSQLIYDRMATARRLSRWSSDMLGPMTHGQRLFLAFSSALGEETLFRGVILHTWGFWASVLFFAAAHLSPMRDIWLYLVFSFTMGVCFAWATLASGTILAAFIAHFFINFINLWLISRRVYEDDLEAREKPWMLAFSSRGPGISKLLRQHQGRFNRLSNVFALDHLNEGEREGKDRARTRAGDQRAVDHHRRTRDQAGVVADRLVDAGMGGHAATLKHPVGLERDRRRAEDRRERAGGLVGFEASSERFGCLKSRSAFCAARKQQHIRRLVIQAFERNIGLDRDASAASVEPFAGNPDQLHLDPCPPEQIGGYHHFDLFTAFGQEQPNFAHAFSLLSLGSRSSPPKPEGGMSAALGV